MKVTIPPQSLRITEEIAFEASIGSVVMDTSVIILSPAACIS